MTREGRGEGGGDSPAAPFLAQFFDAVAEFLRQLADPLGDHHACGGRGDGETGRRGERERLTERERQTDRQTDRQTEKQTLREGERERREKRD